MGKDLAVAVIHGIGTQRRLEGDLAFSRPLCERVAGRLGPSRFEQIAWREIHWSEVIAERQEEYVESIKDLTRSRFFRRFFVNNFGDAGAYQHTHATALGDDDEPSHNTYSRIHAEVSAALFELQRLTSPQAPLVILAHSLGGHIMSNYIYDVQQRARRGQFAFQNVSTVAGLITFGCNIPLFLFSYPKDGITPIARPDSGLPAALRRETWWLNFHGVHDLLGYPLAPAAPAYADLACSDQLKDHSIWPGNWLTRWNTLSHNSYWHSRRLASEISAFLGAVLEDLERAPTS